MAMPQIGAVDPYFRQQMDQYWRDTYEPTPGQTYEPLDFPLNSPETSPFTDEGYLAPGEDAPYDPNLGPRYIQPAGPIHQSHPGYPYGGFYQNPMGDWGQQQYPYNPIDYQAPWNVGPYDSWPGYIPAQPFTPEMDYLQQGPFAGVGPMQQMPSMFQDVPYAQQLQGLEGYF